MAERGAAKGLPVAHVAAVIDRAALLHGSNGEPYAPREIVGDVAIEGPGPRAGDMCVLLDYIDGRLSTIQSQRVERRLDADDRLYSLSLLIEEAQENAQSSLRSA